MVGNTFASKQKPKWTHGQPFVNERKTFGDYYQMKID